MTGTRGFFSSTEVVSSSVDSKMSPVMMNALDI